MYFQQPKGVAVHDGFPNAATDTAIQTLDLNKLLIKNSVSTYFFRAHNNDWREYGILRGDILVIDRARPAGKNDLVIWWEEESFRLSLKHRVAMDRAVWGTLTGVVRQLGTPKK
ncbi:MAG: hypothetical protein U5L95_03875 [Candidatus Saccharibacteria bacterium]|nr:hypothetical protein [Candidatus Saccharibacteria bacterium]